MSRNYDFERYKISLNIVTSYLSKMKAIIKEDEDLLKTLSKFYNTTQDSSLADSNVSVRLYNILISHCPLFKKSGTDTKISVLKNLSVSEFLLYRGSGKSLLKELHELCYTTGIAMMP